jgi:uncharacterized protein YdaU (DUF1376 family)
MADQPFLPFFVGDFLGATVLWEGEERALYMLMLAYQWSGGALPADLEKLSRALGYPHKKFLSLWQTVGVKFDVQGSTLLNERLELHRAKTVELSAARSNAGSVGGKASAAKRAAQAGPKDGAKAAAKPVAKVQANDQPIVEATVQANGAAGGIQKPTILSDPIHPIPIRSNPCADPELLRTHNAGDGNQGEPSEEGDAPPPREDAGRSGRIPSVDLAWEAFQRVQAAYPQFAGDQSDWGYAERACQQRVAEGASWADLEASARRFATYVAAGGRSGPAYVDLPSKFFADARGKWTQAWTQAPTKAEQRLEGNLAAAAEAKRQLFGSST